MTSEWATGSFCASSQCVLIEQISCFSLLSVPLSDPLKTGGWTQLVKAARMQALGPTAAVAHRKVSCSPCFTLPSHHSRVFLKYWVSLQCCSRRQRKRSPQDMTSLCKRFQAEKTTAQLKEHELRPSDLWDTLSSKAHVIQSDVIQIFYPTRQRERFLTTEGSLGCSWMWCWKTLAGKTQRQYH